MAQRLMPPKSLNSLPILAGKERRASDGSLWVAFAPHHSTWWLVQEEPGVRFVRDRHGQMIGVHDEGIILGSIRRMD